MIASASMSIAAITACSASSEYGGRRFWYGSRAGGAIEYSTGELDIFPRGAFPGLVAQQRGRVVRDDERNAVVPVHRAPELPDRRLGAEESLGSERPEGNDDFRANQLHLAHQVRAARHDFVRVGIPVAGGPMFEDVRYEHLVTRQVDRRQDLGQQLTRRADERSPRLVLVLARRLADAHEVRVRVALARHG